MTTHKWSQTHIFSLVVTNDYIPDCLGAGAYSWQKKAKTYTAKNYGLGHKARLKLKRQ